MCWRCGDIRVQAKSTFSVLKDKTTWQHFKKDLDRSLRQSWSLMPVYLRVKTTAAAAAGSESCHLLPLSTHLLVLNRFQNRREFRQTWEHLSLVTAPLQTVAGEEQQLAAELTGWWSYSAWWTLPQKQLSGKQQIYTKGKKKSGSKDFSLVRSQLRLMLEPKPWLFMLPFTLSTLSSLEKAKKQLLF